MSNRSKAKSLMLSKKALRRIPLKNLVTKKKTEKEKVNLAIIHRHGGGRL